MEVDPPAAPAKVPVTVLTGFLGSGKTTLVKHILCSTNSGIIEKQNPDGSTTRGRIAVIQNEFSNEMGIEKPTLVDGGDGQEYKELWELPNGCICCSAKNDFVGAIDALLKFQGDGGGAADKKIGQIVVECTGVADPEAVIDTFWVDEGLESRIFLDCVVCLVDSTTIEHALVHGNEVVAAESSVGTGSKWKKPKGEDERRPNVLWKEARKQLICADVVLMNKVDLFLAGVSGTAAGASAGASGSTPSPKRRKSESGGESSDATQVQDAAGSNTTAAAGGDREADLTRLEEMLRAAYNPDAVFHRTEHSKVALQKIMGVNAFDPGRTVQRLAEQIANLAKTKWSHATTHRSHHGVDGTGHSHTSGNQHFHEHHHALSSIVVYGRPGEKFDRNDVEAGFGGILWGDGTAAPGRDAGADGRAMELYRAKGIFTDEDTGRLHALQAVGENFEVVDVFERGADSSSTATASEAPAVPQQHHDAKFLFIGLNLDEKRLKESILGEESDEEDDDEAPDLQKT